MNLPFAPIEELVRHEWSGAMHANRSNTEFAVADIALRLHVDPSFIYRWRRNGLTPWRADQLAIHLDLHPALIWPEQWAADLAAPAA